MLSDLECNQVLTQQGASPAAIRLVAQIRGGLPVCVPYPSARAAGGRFPSQKMKHVVVLANPVALSAAILMDRDPTTLEYWSWPTTLKLRYRAASGKMTGYRHKVQFLCIARDAITLEDWQPSRTVERWSHDRPDFITLGPDGRWQCPPAQAAANELGFAYRLQTDADINPILLRNTQFLMDYYRWQREDDLTRFEALWEFLQVNAWCTIDSLMHEFPALSRDDLFWLIARQYLTADLDHDLLINASTCRIYRDEDSMLAYRYYLPAPADAPHDGAPYAPSLLELHPHSEFSWDGCKWTVLNLGGAEVTLEDERHNLVILTSDQFITLAKDGKFHRIGTPNRDARRAEAAAIVRAASPAQIKEANRRWNLIGTAAPPNDVTGPRSSRSLRRYRAQRRYGEHHWGSGYIGVLAAVMDRPGNRKPRLDKQVDDIIEHEIATHFENPRNVCIRRTFERIGVLCDKAQLQAPCENTIRRRIRARDQYRLTLQRRGRKAAYQVKIHFWYLDRTTPRHGDRAIEIAHIDHTEIELELVCSRTGKSLGRAWLSLMVDAHTREILAFVLTYDPPSYRTVLMIIRECVRRHGRLPAVLVVDGGKDLHCVWFEMFCALYLVTVVWRKPAEPRAGGVIERVFGTSQTQFFHALLGNTQLMRDPRTLVPEVNPANLAVWSLPALRSRFKQYAFDIYGTTDHSALGVSPQEARLRSLADTGNREFTIIPYDEDFVFDTLPSTPKGTARVQSAGVKINYLYYSTPAMAPFLGQDISVKYDPWNWGRAYAYIAGKWTECESEFVEVFSGRTESEIKDATAEYRKRRQDIEAGRPIAARKLAEFLLELDHEETTQLRHLRDHDNQNPDSTGEPAKPSSHEGVPARAIPGSEIETDGAVDDFDDADNPFDPDVDRDHDVSGPY